MDVEREREGRDKWPLRNEGRGGKRRAQPVYLDIVESCWMRGRAGQGREKGKDGGIKVRVDLVDPLLNGSSAGRKGKEGRKKGKVGRGGRVVWSFQSKGRGRGGE